jgi:hypothetical protein
MPAIDVDTLATIAMRAASIEGPGRSRVLHALNGQGAVDADL